MATLTETLPTLNSVRPEKVYGSSLLRVAENFDFIQGHERILAIAELFQAQTELMVVGVCDEDGRAVGIMTRVHLFNLLGKPYGREILGRKPISDIAEPVESFHMNANLFQTAEKLQGSMDRSSLHYYLLNDTEGCFRGVFSSKDLLSHLSKITQEDIHLASQLQERLVKGRMSQQTQGWAVEAFCQSAKGLGGDFYHVMPLADGRLFVALGDVSGKGVAASVLTSLLWGVLQFYDYRWGLKRLLAQINEALIRTFHLEKYLTGVFLLFDPATHEISVADMGHGHGWLIRGDQARRFPGSGTTSGINLPLGIDLALDPKVLRAKLKAGDLVCLYTDGLTEQENEAGEEFSEGRVLRMARQLVDTPEALPDALANGLARHQGTIPRLDDVTWLQLQIR